MRSWTPTGHRLSGAVFWVIWALVAAAAGVAGFAGVASSGGPLWGGVYGLGAALILVFGVIFGRYAEDPRWPIGAVVIGAGLMALAVERSGASDIWLLAGAAAGLALAMIALLRFVKTPLPAVVLAAVLAATGFFLTFGVSMYGAPASEIAAETPATASPIEPAPEQAPTPEPPTDAPAPPPPPPPPPAPPSSAEAKPAPVQAPSVAKPGSAFVAPRLGDVLGSVIGTRSPDRSANSSSGGSGSNAPKIAIGGPRPAPPAPPPEPTPDSALAEDEASAAPPPANAGAAPDAGAAPERTPFPEAQKVGAFLVNKPERMSVLKSVQIEVQVGVEGEPAPTELGSGGPVTTREIEVSRKMDVELVSNDFDVTADGKNGALLVLPGKPARWAWQVKPRSTGPGKLIKVNVYSVLGEDRALIKTHQETIEVTVTPVERATLVARWSKENWEPLASLVGGIVAAFGFVSGLLGLRKKKPGAA